ncbi:MATE family efflux transporter [Peptostreptococcus sp. D1]|uniref:MATE family efflux transporter n=1 Tax=Peptostreptococcus sp. D1 TaxID=72304 RepID=UPI0008F2B7C3|nr:MATE family efflux transporter [Peptostreptococcus sp. D1]SFE53825.1 putative efflux protein, MATE family [Peptostreptococcus sp. D1]
MNSKISLPKASAKNKMEVMPILPLILNMSIPPLCSMFLQYTYNFVDCIFVSWISEDALTAVSLSFPITTLMLAMSIGIGVGINVLISKNLGGKNFDEANSVVTHGLLISTVLGIVLNLIILLIIKPYFRAIIQDYSIYSLAIKYMTICAFFQVPNMIHIAIQKIIQGTGNMIAPMLFQMAGVLLNFVLDPILIFGFGPFPKMGAEGAAISTVLGYTLSMMLAFYVLIFTKQKVKIKIRDFKINLEIFKSIVILGLPSFIMNALGAFMVSFANMFLIVYSTTAVAFFGAYFKAQQVVVMTVNGLIQGCIPIMSFNYGAKNKDRLLDTFKKGTIIAVLLMTLGALLLAVFPRQVLKIFMASDSMMELGVPALRIMVCSYIFNGISTMLASLMQSIGQVKYSVYINLSRQLALLIPFMWIFTRFCGITGVWIAFPITEILTLLFCWHIYKKQERWM